jgi:hypothetical protein
MDRVAGVYQLLRTACKVEQLASSTNEVGEPASSLKLQ